MSTTTPTAQGRFGLRSSGIAMTPQQFDTTPESAWDDRYRYELINGVLVVTPPVSDAEADPNDDLGHMLRTFKEFHPLGGVLDRTMPERTVPGTPNRRRCDRAIWTGSAGSQIPRETSLQLWSSSSRPSGATSFATTS